MVFGIERAVEVVCPPGNPPDPEMPDLQGLYTVLIFLHTKVKPLLIDKTHPQTSNFPNSNFPSLGGQSQRLASFSAPEHFPASVEVFKVSHRSRLLQEMSDSNDFEYLTSVFPPLTVSIRGLKHLETPPQRPLFFLLFVFFLHQPQLSLKQMRRH